MSAEKLKIGIPEDRQGHVRSWSEMCDILKSVNIDMETVPAKLRRYATSYFHAQKLIAEGNPDKAKKIFSNAAHRKDYETFEDKHSFLLGVIDVAVKGKSQQNQW